MDAYLALNHGGFCPSTMINNFDPRFKTKMGTIILVNRWSFSPSSSFKGYYTQFFFAVVVAVQRRKIKINKRVSELCTTDSLSFLHMRSLAWSNVLNGKMTEEAVAVWLHLSFCINACNCIAPSSSARTMMQRLIIISIDNYLMI